MEQYLEAQVKVNNLILNGSVQNHEINRFSKSEQRWADSKTKNTFQMRRVKKGEIYQFEFGKNFVPEMSYEHRGLIIGVNKKLLYVLPIFSYDPKRHLDVYHRLEHPESKSALYLLKSADYSFIKHDSVLKLNDIRTLSINRILYKYTEGRIDITSEEYRDIEKSVLKKYFPEFAYVYEHLLEENRILMQKNQTLEKLFLHN